MAIKRIKKMILGLFCLIFSTSALAYNFLPAYAPAVEKPRAEGAESLAETSILGAVGSSAVKPVVKTLQPSRVSAQVTPVETAAVDDQTPTVNERWVAAWIPVPPKADVASTTTSLVSEWIDLPQQNVASDVEHSKALAAAANAETFALTPELRLRRRTMRANAASLPVVLTASLAKPAVVAQAAAPDLALSKNLPALAIAALGTRPMIQSVNSEFATVPVVFTKAISPAPSATARALPQVPLSSTPSSISFPGTSSAFTAPIAMASDPLPGMPPVFTAHSIGDLPKASIIASIIVPNIIAPSVTAIPGITAVEPLPTQRHISLPIQPFGVVADALPFIPRAAGARSITDLPKVPVIASSNVPNIAIPSATALPGIAVLDPLPKQPLIRAAIQPMASVVTRPQVQLQGIPVLAPETSPLDLGQRMTVQTKEPNWAAVTKPLPLLSVRPEISALSISGLTATTSDGITFRRDISMPEAPKPVIARLAETIKDPLPMTSFALLASSPVLAAAPSRSQPAVMAGEAPALAKRVTAAIPITGQITLGQALLASLDNRIDSAEPLPSVTAGGPSWTPPEMAVKPNANAVLETKPVTITASAGFSSEFLRPMSTRAVFPPSPESYAVSTPFPGQATQPGSYCDPNFVGPPIRFAQTVDLRLDDLLSQLNSRFGVNFIVGPEVGHLPLNVKAGSIPWNVLLRSQLYVSGVRATCIGSDTIELVMNAKVSELEKAKIDAEPLQTRYIKLKYLQPSSSSNKNIAGQDTAGSGNNAGNLSGGDCQQGANGNGGSFGGGNGSGGNSQQQLPQRCKFERLMNEIRQILGLNNMSVIGNTGPAQGDVPTVNTGSAAARASDVPKRVYVGQVPGRNMLVVNASATQLRDIEELIRHADVPPFQIVIKALVYTANETKLRDLGAQTSVIFGSPNLHQLGGITSQPSVSSTTSTGSTSGTSGTTGTTSTTTGTTTNSTVPPGALNPGGVRTLGPGFLAPLGTGDSVFGLSAIVGTAQFSMQITALQQNGVLALKSRPFATVLDGDTADLSVGRQIPVIIQAANNLGGAPGTLEILQAANLLSVTPHVIDDENGNATAVNLELRLESNDVDTSVVSQGVPAVAVKSIQSNFILNQEQTAILGGFTVDSDSKTVSKTPGLGDVPILGELFKRRVNSSQINRLYFAISVTVIPYGGPIEPVHVPGGTTDPPSLTENMVKRAEAAEPPKAVPSPTPKH